MNDFLFAAWTVSIYAAAVIFGLLCVLLAISLIAPWVGKNNELE
jgi:hypothetical protein